ncbi:unnamed protein product [Prorocentrum cordatum]|uniref:RRM domain-containing protein n=1 Tax=Prorocentrum cordatum TaxID=2364126 RepID=A0ABN9WH28_9DINO|nr:unnamed protein product [Polarella glacialis]
MAEEKAKEVEKAEEPKVAEPEAKAGKEALGSGDPEPPAQDASKAPEGDKAAEKEPEKEPQKGTEKEPEKGAEKEEGGGEKGGEGDGASGEKEKEGEAEDGDGAEQLDKLNMSLDELIQSDPPRGEKRGGKGGGSKGGKGGKQGWGGKSKDYGGGGWGGSGGGGYQKSSWKDKDDGNDWGGGKSKKADWGDAPSWRDGAKDKWGGGGGGGGGGGSWGASKKSWGDDSYGSKPAAKSWDYDKSGGYGGKSYDSYSKPSYDKSSYEKTSYDRGSYSKASYDKGGGFDKGGYDRGSGYEKRRDDGRDAGGRGYDKGSGAKAGDDRGGYDERDRGGTYGRSGGYAKDPPPRYADRDDGRDRDRRREPPPSAPSRRRAPADDEPQEGHTVVVAGIQGLRLDKRDLERAFSTVGDVAGATLGSSSAKITFTSRSAAQEAVRRFNGGQLNDCTIDVYLEGFLLIEATLESRPLSVQGPELAGSRSWHRSGSMAIFEIKMTNYNIPTDEHKTEERKAQALRHSQRTAITVSVPVARPAHKHITGDLVINRVPPIKGEGDELRLALPPGQPPEMANEVIDVTPPKRIQMVRCQDKYNNDTESHRSTVLSIYQPSHQDPASFLTDEARTGRLQTARVVQDIARDMFTGHVDTSMILTQLRDIQDGVDELRAAGGRPGPFDDATAPTPTDRRAVGRNCGSRWRTEGVPDLRHA